MATEAGAKVETLSTVDGEPPQVGKRAYRTQKDGKKVNQSQTLGQQVKYGTPTASMTVRSKKFRRKTPTPAEVAADLEESKTIEKFPTPDANCWKGGKRKGQLTDPACGVTPNGGRLNPQWVEWLMGFPIGWTDCEDSETQ